MNDKDEAPQLEELKLMHSNLLARASEILNFVRSSAPPPPVEDSEDAPIVIGKNGNVPTIEDDET